MPKITETGGISVVAPYYHYRLIAANIVKLLIFRGAILSESAVKKCVVSLAYMLTGKFFARSTDLVIHRDAVDLFRHLLVLAPILNRDRLGVRMEQDFGHLSTWFRMAVGQRQRRFHYARTVIERVPDVDRLQRVMRDSLRITDRNFVDSCARLMDCYYGPETLSGALASRIFDPIMAIGTQPGNAIRMQNEWHRLERKPFENSVNLQQTGIEISDYRLKLAERKNGAKALQVFLADQPKALFQAKVKTVLASSDNPAKKVEAIQSHIGDLTEHTKWAYSARPQIEELSNWLKLKVQDLSATEAEASRLPKQLLSRFDVNVERRLFFTRNNFFFDPRAVSEKQFATYMSPYRWREYK